VGIWVKENKENQWNWGMRLEGVAGLASM
jgi:hypothetical protein